MAKAEYSYAELQQMLESARENELVRLRERRDQLAAEIAECERQIDELGGGGGGRLVRRRKPGGRVRNQPSLKQLISDTLLKSKKPLSTDDIMDRVKAAGYKTQSGDFRKVLYLNLFNMRRDGLIKYDSASKLYGVA